MPIAPPVQVSTRQDGILTWTPNLFQAGTYANVVFGASDGNKTAFQTIAINVTEYGPGADSCFRSASSRAARMLPVQFSLGRDQSGQRSRLPTPRSRRCLPTPSSTPDRAVLLDARLYSGRQLYADLCRDCSQRTQRHHTVTIQIANVDRPPTIQVVDQSVLVGNTLNFTVVGNDPDAGDVLTYSATGLPAGASLDPNSGAFTWTPSAGQAGIILLSSRYPTAS